MQLTGPTWTEELCPLVGNESARAPRQQLYRVALHLQNKATSRGARRDPYVRALRVALSRIVRTLGFAPCEPCLLQEVYFYYLDMCC